MAEGQGEGEEVKERVGRRGREKKERYSYITMCRRNYFSKKI